MDKYLKINNSEIIHYLYFGRGKKIILLPSMWLTSHSYARLGIKLSQSYQVYIPDLFRGKSTFGHPAKNLIDYAEKLNLFIGRLNIQHYYLVGISLSGLIAMKFISKYNLLPLKLFLISTTAAPIDIKRRGFILFLGYIKLLFNNLFSLKGIKTNLLWFADTVINLFTHPIQVFYEYLIALTDFSKSTIKKMPIRSKILFAKKDEFLSQVYIEKMKQIDNLELEIIDDTHGWFFYRENELVGKIASFFGHRIKKHNEVQLRKLS